MRAGGLIMHGNFLGGLLLACMLAGCAGAGGVEAGSGERLRASFGDAVREVRTRQTLYPDASSNSEIATGIDAQAAVSAWRRYQDSFRAPPPAFEVLGIGTATR